MSKIQSSGKDKVTEMNHCTELFVKDITKQTLREEMAVADSDV